MGVMPLVAHLLAVLLLTGACGGHGDHADAGGPLSEPARQAVAGICTAAGSDPEGARSAFASVHGQLHDLGDALTARDRTEAAAFLRAKGAVEADLSGDAPADKLSVDLGALSQAITAALDVLDVPAPTC